MDTRGHLASFLSYVLCAVSPQVEVNQSMLCESDGNTSTVPLGCCVHAQRKVELIDRLAAAGCKAIEAASFVSPKWVPQMADGGQVLANLGRAPGVKYAALTPNLRGLEAALEAGADEVQLVGTRGLPFVPLVQPGSIGHGGTAACAGLLVKERQLDVTPTDSKFLFAEHDILPSQVILLRHTWCIHDRYDVHMTCTTTRRGWKGDI